MLREVDRGVIRQLSPLGNAGTGPIFVILNPRSRRNANKRARAGATNGLNGLVHSHKTFIPFGCTRMEVKLSRPDGDAECAILRHVFQLKRNSRMEVAGACTVETGLNNHVVPIPENRLTPSLRGSQDCPHFSVSETDVLWTATSEPANLLKIRLQNASLYSALSIDMSF